MHWPRREPSPTRGWSCRESDSGGPGVLTRTRCAGGAHWLSGAHRGRAQRGQAAGRYVEFGEVESAARAPPRQARRRGPRSGQDLYPGDCQAERSSQRPTGCRAVSSMSRAARAYPNIWRSSQDIKDIFLDMKDNFLGYVSISLQLIHAYPLIYPYLSQIFIP